MKAIQSLIVGGAAALLVTPAMAQFDSGSSGTDGALNIVANTVLPVQEDGVHEYTTINVNPGVTLSFSPNSLNTPVIFLATGDVTIDGTINIKGQNSDDGNSPIAGLPGSEPQPGPGGFPGGIGGKSQVGVNARGTSGGGPGGGAAANTETRPSNRGAAGNGGSHFTAGGTGSGNPNGPAPTYGDPRLITLSGGSGGAGGNVYITSATTTDGPSGGAGGGAITIASSGTITINGTINARGGEGRGAAGFGGAGYEGSGGGAGGAVRLMANAIGGSGSVDARGGTGTSAVGGDGLVVMEALGFSGNLVQNTNPLPTILAAPTVVSLDEADIPTIQITAIDGSPVSQPPSGSTTIPDVIIPDTAMNPIAIDLATANVPDGSTVNLRIVRDNSEIEMASGTVMSNAATVQADLASGVGVIYATVEFP